MNIHLLLPDSISRLISALEKTPSMNNTILLDLLSETNLKLADVSSLSYFDHPAEESYGRREIYRSDRLKIFVMAWNPGDFTAIHDHEPDEWGAVQFFGTISHRLYALENNQIVLKQAGDVPSGVMVGVTGSLIHAMGNNTEVPILTLHIYGTNSSFGPELQTRVYELEKERIILTDGSAYLNLEDHAFEIAGNITADEATLTSYLNDVRPFLTR